MNSYSPRNRLLLAVPTRHLKELMADLEFIPCQCEQILLDADSSLDHIFFPESGVVSVVAVYADGNIIEMATIGWEGCTGVQTVFGAKASSARPLVEDVSRRVRSRDEVYAFVPRPHVRLRSSLPRAGAGVGRM
jgi:hypothetical protein